MNTIVDKSIFNLLFDKDYNEWKKFNKAVLENPTIAEVIMWLYEKHNIYVHISPCGDDDALFKDCKWWFSIYKDTLDNMMGGTGVDENVEECNNMTEAYLEAIKYCLTNLI